MIRKLLIANRGEIAVRIIRTCRILGITTVVAYSDCDKDTFAVFLADESVCIGGNKSTESYLNIGNIIDAAKQTGCDAIHPGYGFLSEDAEFAKRVAENGLLLIGPSWKVLQKTTNKSVMKHLAQSLNIPVIPDADDGQKGPLMAKACHGGGGMGIRVIDSQSNYDNSVDMARKEVQESFNHGDIIFEKVIDTYKHIDLQFLADKSGNISLFPARDCSIQQNFQKIIEETPATNIPKNILKKMQRDAINLIVDTKYDNVGTVEFLLDKDYNYYFLEINSRLQVEHTVSEEATDIDLVEQQLRMATGENNSLPNIITAKKHAIECRIRANESGEVSIFNLPSGKDVRLDTYIYQGYNVKPWYDALIAKVIVSDKDRTRAISKMKTALDETIIRGITTNVDELYELIDAPSFADGNYSYFGFKQ